MKCQSKQNGISVKKHSINGGMYMKKKIIEGSFISNAK